MATGVATLHPDKPLSLFIIEVGVSARHRQRGIARRRIATLLEEGRALGCSDAWVATELDNAPARALYRSSGAIEDAEPAVVCVFSLTQTATPAPAAS